jgi:N-methylhydantoinase A
MDDLGIPTVIVPYTATAHSAYGFVCSDICHHLASSHYFRNPDDPAPFNAIFSDLEQKGRALLTKEGVPGQDMVFTRFVDMRFSGQIFEITIEIPSKRLEAADLQSVMAGFEAAYDKMYGEGTGWKEAGMEIINFRLEAVGKMRKPTLKKFPVVGGDPQAARKGKRPCYFAKAGGFVETAVYAGEALLSGMTLRGPAIVHMPSTSALVAPEQEAQVDAYRNILIRHR